MAKRAKNTKKSKEDKKGAFEKKNVKGDNQASRDTK